MPNAHAFSIRQATPDDADQIVAILEEIASERIYTAISNPWSAAEQKRHIAALSPRELIHVAETEAKVLIGYQVLELWAPTLASMAHVGQVGTFVVPAWRGRAVGAGLFRRTLDFAEQHGYAKFVIHVRSTNTSGQAFYRGLGFLECGRLTRQVRIHDEEDDEILMERFL